MTRAAAIERGAEIRRSALKRAFDIAFGITGLALTAPVSLLIAAAIKIDDGGPIFYVQERSGVEGRTFSAWKFRSMVPGSGSARQAAPRDPRVTRVGRLLRITALDEIPQLWNIARGDMSVVGPRALAPREIETHARSGAPEPLESVPGFDVRASVRPGLTGIAQIYARRDLPRRQKFRYDRLYIRRQSFWLDLRLVAQSLAITVTGSWERRGHQRPRGAR